MARSGELSHLISLACHQPLFTDSKMLNKIDKLLIKSLILLPYFEHPKFVHFQETVHINGLKIQQSQFSALPNPIF